jgi:hypothetical protein
VYRPEAIGEKPMAFFTGICYPLYGKSDRAALDGQPRAAVATWIVEGTDWILIFLVKGDVMNNAINPEAAQPSTIQAFEQSDRNPSVTNWGGTDADGGQIPGPASAESRVTQPGPMLSPNAGLQNYDTGDSADSIEDEAEREG